MILVISCVETIIENVLEIQSYVSRTYMYMYALTRWLHIDALQIYSN